MTLECGSVTFHHGLSFVAKFSQIVLTVVQIFCCMIVLKAFEKVIVLLQT